MTVTDEQRKQLGRDGEDFVTEWLADKGFEIVRRNFFVRGGEIDIIAKKDDLLIFVEVRAWDHQYWPDSSPVMTIKRPKMRRIVKAARYFMMKSGIEEYKVFIRFDVAGVIRKDKSFEIDYYEAAFDSEGNV